MDYPCEDYATEADFEASPCECVVDDPATIPQLLQCATQVMWIATGRVITGVCESTVRPVGSDACGRPHDCGRTMPSVALQGPVVSVDEVKIDGVVLPAASYRMLDAHRLIRVRASAGDPVLTWPACQALDLPDTEPGTWSITYKHGEQVPAFLTEATLEYACELAKQAHGEPSALPDGTISVSRNQLSLQLASATESIRGQELELRAVRHAVALLNPYSQPLPSAVWSPDGTYTLHRVT